VKLSLERLLQSQGFGTRKECRRMVRKGALFIAGEQQRDPFCEVDTATLTEFCIDGERVRYRASVYIALHKPAGYECSRSPSHHESVFALLPAPFSVRGVQPAGRLDQDATGLLLLSDDGAFIHTVTAPRRHLHKRYHIRTAEPVADDVCQTLLDGVLLRGDAVPTCAAACRPLGAHELELEITQGKYHQVKRMIAAAGNRCVGLHRVAIGGVNLEALGLEVGTWCDLDESQRSSLRAVGAPP
jgi:16S rRNA pseudouridine516 synthase